jgi:hypothetical protein
VNNICFGGIVTLPSDGDPAVDRLPATRRGNAMSQLSSQPDVRIPRWLVWLGSIAIAVHLAAVSVNTLAAPSGPWPSPEGGEIVRPPFLAANVNSVLIDYLRPIRLSANYHFLANRIPGNPGVYLEFRLKDENNKDVATVKLPDETANPWVRHRQALLTQQVSWEDQRVTPPQGEVIAAPGQEVPKTQYWDMDKGQLNLVTVDINQVPRNRPVSGPSDWSFLLGRAYARYLCRTSGAAKVELLRHHQDAIRPIVLIEDVPANAFPEIISNFGEFSK